MSLAHREKEGDLEVKDFLCFMCHLVFLLCLISTIAGVCTASNSNFNGDCSLHTRWGYVIPTYRMACEFEAWMEYKK